MVEIELWESLVELAKSPEYKACKDKPLSDFNQAFPTSDTSLNPKIKYFVDLAPQYLLVSDIPGLSVEVPEYKTRAVSTLITDANRIMDSKGNFAADKEWLHYERLVDAAWKLYYKLSVEKLLNIAADKIRLAN